MENGAAQLNTLHKQAQPSFQDPVTHPEVGQPLLKHIPRGARLACSQSLTNILHSICSCPSDLDGWRALLRFAPDVLAQPKRAGRRHNLANIVKRRVETLGQSTEPPVVAATAGTGCGAPLKRSDARLAAVASKLEDGNISAAVRILCDQSRPATPNLENFNILVGKHPTDPHPDSLAGLPCPTTTTPFQVEQLDVEAAIRSFPSGSAGGPDGLRPQHLLELINHRESSSALLRQLTEFINILLRGACPPEVRPVLFGGSLIALTKKSGDLRPIAIGYTLRRVAAKCANRYAVGKLASFFAPLQVGIATPAGCEAAVHAARKYVSAMPQDHVFVKLDFSNAFNSLHRDIMLQSAYTVIPEIYSFVHQSYSSASVLKFGPFSISSQMGPQQGDPLGPLLFCLPLQPVLHSMQSDLCIGYLDDLSLGGSPETVANDIASLVSLNASFGLNLNLNKCEFYSPSIDSSKHPSFSELQCVDFESLTLLGAALFKGSALDGMLQAHCETLGSAIDDLCQLPAQSSLTLLRSSFGAPKLSHVLRCSPCQDHPTLGQLDEIMRNGLERIINISLNKHQWMQASLPIRDGGLGLRRVSSLASSAYMASAASTLELQAAILTKCTTVPDAYFEEMMVARHDTLPAITESLPAKQGAWDRPLVERDKLSIMASMSNPVDRARMAAACFPHSGDWLTALPITSCGLCIDNEAVRVAVGLRLGLDLCRPHTCRCGDAVGSDGHHGLVCRLSKGRSIRHHAINDLIWRSLQSADIPSTKEPTGLLRTDGKRPDGATLVPWSAGKYMTWDATVVHTCAASYLSQTAISAGSAAEQAAIHKTAKYALLPATHMFVPVAFETLGPVNSEGAEFLSELGRRISVVSGDQRETKFLFQRLSICVQRHNAIAFRGTFPDGCVNWDEA